MPETTSPPTIYQALNLVMRDVQAVEKKDRNSQAGFNFRGIDAVTNAVGPALRAHGVIVVPEVLDYHYGPITVGQGDRAREMGHARLTIAFTWYGPAGDSIRSVAAGEAFDAGDKATAKAHSVAFRTAMLQTLCLPTDEPDPDEDQYSRPVGGRSNGHATQDNGSRSAPTTGDVLTGYTKRIREATTKEALIELAQKISTAKSLSADQKNILRGLYDERMAELVPNGAKR